MKFWRVLSVSSQRKMPLRGSTFAQRSHNVVALIPNSCTGLHAWTISSALICAPNTTAGRWAGVVAVAAAAGAEAVVSRGSVDVATSRVGVDATGDRVLSGV